MLDINFIRENKEEVKERLSLKGIEVDLVNKFLEADRRWRELVGRRDEKKAEQKEAGRDGIERAREIKREIQETEEEIINLSREREKILEQLPNLPDDEAPAGRDERNNAVIREVGEKPKFDFEPKDHVELGEKLELIDTKRAGEVAGARFSYLLGDLVLMEMGLVELAFKEAVKEGFQPVLPPVLVRPEIMKKMGKGKFMESEDAFYLEKDNLYLAGSAEHTIGPMHMDEILEERELPLRYIGFSTAFRREAGSYGKDTRGILRRHQFDKAEMFSFCHPEKSREEHRFLIMMQER